MPGAYPEELVNSQEKLDRFWNLRLGIPASLVPAFLTWHMVSPATALDTLIAAFGAVIIWGLCLGWVFQHNIFGRIMAILLGPYTPEER